MRLFVTALAILLAGCLGGGPADSTASPSDARPEGEAIAPVGPAAGGSDPAEARLYTGSFKLVVRPDVQPTSFVTATQDCMLFWSEEGPTYSIESATLNASWEPQPTTGPLRLTASGGDEYLTSPWSEGSLSWDIAAFPLRSDGRGAGFGVDSSLQQGSAPLDQEVTLDILLWYVGTLPEPSRGFCVDGDP